MIDPNKAGLPVTIVPGTGLGYHVQVGNVEMHEIYCTIVHLASQTIVGHPFFVSSQEFAHVDMLVQAWIEQLHKLADWTGAVPSIRSEMLASLVTSLVVGIGVQPHGLFDRPEERGWEA